MDEIDRGRDMLHGRIGEDPMSKIENVPRTASRPPENVRHSSLDFRYRRKQGYRVQVSLHRTIVPHHGPGLIKRDTPINADHIAARLSH